MARKTIPTPTAQAPTTLIDTYVDAPEGSQPEKLHILLDRKSAKAMETYKKVLMASRRIPHNNSTVTIGDWLAIYYLTQLKDTIADDQTRSQEAIALAISTYSEWANEAEQDAWTLALLRDNEFTNEPTPYVTDSDDLLPGIIPTPEAPKNLMNPTEKRLKQILDFTGQDFEFHRRVEAAVNEAIAGAVRLIETDAAGFHGR